MPRISVVIPNWNGERFLMSCLSSLRKQRLLDCEIILVDNCSSDGSLPLVAKEFPEVRVIKLDRNTGFAHAVNAGIRASSSPLIALLNNDTETDPDWLAALDSAAAKHPEASSFASNMLDFSRRDTVDSHGNGMSWSGRPYKIDEGKQDGRPQEHEAFVFGACAGAAAYRAELFEKIGLFDEVFVTYLEDVDLDFRAQLAGFKCLYVPGAVVYHIGAATSGKGSAFAFKMMIKNHFHLIAKNYPLRFFWKNIGKLTYSEIRLVAAAIRDKLLGAYLQGTASAIRESGYALAQRRQIQAGRTACDDYLTRIIVPSFTYKPVHKALHGQ